MSDNLPISPAPTLVDNSLRRELSTARKYVLLLMFCLAQFLDTFNSSALISAIPQLIIVLKMTESESTWLLSAFQLTFASFLLVSGKISDVYNPKWSFIIGVAMLGVFSLGSGFVNDKIGLIILRAFAGIAASMTIPAALTLLVRVFTEPQEQARAISAFGGSGAIGSVLGLIVGAIFVQYASWRWVFWFVAIVALSIAIGGIMLIPAQEYNGDPEGKTSKVQSLDLPGVSILTVALVLFIFAVTSGASTGWGSAVVLAPLFISVAMIVCFFYWETLLPVERAAVPPRTWFYTNFSVLFTASLIPYFWWFTVFDTYTNLWQGVYHWSVISSALHMIPLGISAFVLSFSGSLTRAINRKWLILTGHVLLIASTILLAFADKPERYWSFIFPAFVIGSAGSLLIYMHTNIAIFRTAPVAMTGTVGALFNGGLQLGSAVGIAAVSSIFNNVEAKYGSSSYRGQQASFWFVLAVICTVALSVLVFYRVEARVPSASAESMQEKASSFGGDPQVVYSKETPTAERHVPV